MSTAFGVTPRYRPAPPPIVKAIDRDAPIRPRRRFSPWTTVEDDVLREKASQGVAAIHMVIPHRSPDAIRQRAQNIGVKIKRKVRPGYKQPNRRRNKPMPAHCHPLVKIYIQELNRRSMTWDEAEKDTGVGAGTLRAWSSQSMPRLDTFVAALNAVGFDLKIVRFEEVKLQAEYL